MKFPHEWWAVAEIAFAIASFGESDCKDAFTAWRKTQIGRKAILRARDFDNAARGVRAAMAGTPETIESTLQRSRWYINQGIPPVFARPTGWNFTKPELDAIRISRSRGIEPVCYNYDTTGIDVVPVPATKPNPWDKWVKI